MSRIGFVVLGCAALVMAASVGIAGGRARVTVEGVPSRIEAGKAFELSIVVRPEMGSRHRDVRPLVVAQCEGRIVTVAAAPLGGQRYRAKLELPAAGDWTVRVDSKYCHTVMDPLRVQAFAAARGRDRDRG